MSLSLKMSAAAHVAAVCESDAALPEFEKRGGGVEREFKIEGQAGSEREKGLFRCKTNFHVACAIRCSSRDPIFSPFSCLE